MRNNTTHMVFEGELAVKLHTKVVVVGTSANGNPRQDLVTMGRVHSPGSAITTEALVLFRIQYHSPVIPPHLNLSQVLVN